MSKRTRKEPKRLATRKPPAPTPLTNRWGMTDEEMRLATMGFSLEDSTEAENDAFSRYLDAGGGVPM